MAKFIDYHSNLPPMPEEVQAQLRDNLRNSKSDEYGVTGIDVLIGNNESFCITDAPSAQAVVDSHKNVGFPLEMDDVHQVQSVLD